MYKIIIPCFLLYTYFCTNNNLLNSQIFFDNLTGLFFIQKLNKLRFITGKLLEFVENFVRFSNYLSLNQGYFLPSKLTHPRPVFIAVGRVALHAYKAGFSRMRESVQIQLTGCIDKELAFVFVVNVMREYPNATGAGSSREILGSNRV